MALPDSSTALTRPGTLDLPCPTAPGSRLELHVGEGDVTVVRDPSVDSVRVEVRELRGGRLTARAAGGSLFVSVGGAGAPRAVVLVTLPPSSALTVRTRSAPVLLLTALTAGAPRATGAAEVHSVDGPVEFRRAGGPVVFRTESGAVAVTGLTGRVTGTTGSGGVTLDLSPVPGTPPGDRAIDVRTGSGPIGMRVPPGADARVRASSGTGRVVTDVPGLVRPPGPAAPGSVTASGTLGRGSAAWSLESAAGGVALLRQGPDVPSRGGVG